MFHVSKVMNFEVLQCIYTPRIMAGWTWKWRLAIRGAIN